MVVGQEVWDNIWHVMWIKTLMDPRECSVENPKFFHFSESCPHVEGLLVRTILFQDLLPPLNGHSFVNRISIPH